MVEEEEVILSSAELSEGEMDDFVNDLAHPSQYNGDFNDS